MVAGKAGVLVGSLVGLRTLYVQFIKPHTLKTKLAKAVEMIEAWFDEIDRNVQSGIDLDSLFNRERKINEHIETNLKYYWIKPSKRMIYRWNRKMGIKKELCGSEDLFQKFARIPASGYPLGGFFTMLTGIFLRFHQNYHKTPPGDYNYADIEMPVKFLKFYLREIGYVD